MRIFEYDGEKFVVTEYWPNDKKLNDFKFEQIEPAPICALFPSTESPT